MRSDTVLSKAIKYGSVCLSAPATKHQKWDIKMIKLLSTNKLMDLYSAIPKFSRTRKPSRSSIKVIFYVRSSSAEWKLSPKKDENI